MKKDHNFVYSFFKVVLGIPFYLYYLPKWENKKVIPKEGKVIFCGNHVHMFDQFLPMLATKRIIHYLAKKEYFDGKFAWFFKSTGCISVNRSIQDVKSASLALRVLKEDKALGIFPEGTRNKTEDLLLDFKPGVVSLAQKTGATIVPFVITGQYKFLKGKLKCTFLKPFKVAKTEDLTIANEKLRNMMLQELKKSAK